MQAGFIFDFDGTVADTIPLFIEALKLSFADVGEAFPPLEEVYARFGPTERGAIRLLCPAKADEIYKSYLRHYAELHPKLAPAPFAGMREVIERIRKSGSPLALVTGKNRESADISLSLYGLEGAFNPEKCGADSGPIKPANIAAVLKEWGASAPQKIYYLGDSVQDVIDARECGIIPLAACWSSVVNKALLLKQAPYRLFESVPEFSAWLEEEVGI